ncbi:CpsD/CapB family tyrosine-protein kinase [Halalkalibacterium halodurans]|uniref:CpsD/CapB family tyrosine-protein kinase n=1 Tax=Halalkalibacterium halodurans TaxID=86665 RepID=UPI002E2203BB|nr:CpsD/CapB family tyrosine-protein kinase [Halalkalibacterium halodurans]
MLGKGSKQKNGNKQRELITHIKKNSPISEQYRTIRTNIEFAAVDRELKTIVVTSSGRGEGKSTTSANLAVVMAQNGHNVLFVDADLRKPTAHYTFRAVNTRGLTRVLMRQETLEEAIQETKVENLSLLTSGPIPPNPAELLNSKMMELIIKEVRDRFDIVIIDSPPLNAVTDAQILSSKCDGTVLVISSGKTQKEEALKAKDLLDKSNANLLGVVLNNKELRNSNMYYYYGESDR